MRQLFNRFGAFLWIMTPPWIKKGGVSLFGSVFTVPGLLPGLFLCYGESDEIFNEPFYEVRF